MLCKNKEGSVLLMIAAIMAFILIITLNIMHHVNLLQDIALDRIEQQRQMRAMDALIKYAQCRVTQIVFIPQGEEQEGTPNTTDLEDVNDEIEVKKRELAEDTAPQEQKAIESGAEEYELSPWPTPDSLYQGKIHLAYTIEGCAIHGILSKNGEVLKEVTRMVSFIRKKPLTNE